ncbi:hypothetical protein AAC387_Pa11g2073 [Persea americana]
MAEITTVADTVAVDIQSFKNYVNQQSPVPSFHVDNGKEAQMSEVTYVVDTMAGECIEGLKDSEPTSIPSHDGEQAQTPFHNGEQAYHMAEVICAVDTITVDTEDLEDWISMPSDDDGEIAHMAAVTIVADTVAVDILEGFEDCEQASIPSDDGDEACAVDMVPVAVEDFEDCEQTSIPSDDGEEGCISVDPDWVSSIEEKSLLEPTRLKASPARVSCSIHRVPSWLRDYKETACSPQIISIGPFHYEKRRGELQAMEEHKWRYLRDIRSTKSESWLKDCLATVKGLEQRARNYYSEVIPLDSNSFVEMMVLDGCFIIELFRRFCFNHNDVIFRLAYRKKALSFDLLLLENQIPFFILERLFDLMNPSGSFRLRESASKFFFPDYGTVKDRITNSNIRIRHLLHLVHTSYVLFPKDYTKSCDDPTIPCASRLKELGIRFRKSEVSDTNFLEIKFHKGVIEIPKIELKKGDLPETVVLIGNDMPSIQLYLPPQDISMQLLKSSVPLQGV